MMAFSGVRRSWLMLVREGVFAWLATSAASLARCKSCRPRRGAPPVPVRRAEAAHRLRARGDGHRHRRADRIVDRRGDAAGPPGVVVDGDRLAGLPHQADQALAAPDAAPDEVAIDAGPDAHAHLGPARV